MVIGYKEHLEKVERDCRRLKRKVDRESCIAVKRQLEVVFDNAEKRKRGKRR